eukprot:1277103-Rhodomonas_salina.2
MQAVSNASSAAVNGRLSLTENGLGQRNSLLYASYSWARSRLRSPSTPTLSNLALRGGGANPKASVDYVECRSRCIGCKG